MPRKKPANISLIEDFLYELGPVNFKGQIIFDKIPFSVIVPNNDKELEIFFENPGTKQSRNDFRNKIIKELTSNFSGIKKSQTPGKSPVLSFSDRFIRFRAENDEFFGDSSNAGGVIPTKIQEEGTTIILNQVLHKNKKFNNREDILSDKDTADKLKKLFGTKYSNRLEDWTHSYFEQQKEFLKKFQSNKWDIFTYGSDDFVTFFSGQIKNVARSLDPLRPVGNYTTWNPSDIWAVYEMDKIKKRIADNINPATQNLVELNNLLIDLFRDKKLIGLSLKKVATNKSAKLKFVNIDTSTMRLGDIEDYKISDISFSIDNIFTENKVTTYVKFGKQKDYSINITRAGQNLSFNTSIKATPAAQGGQAPVKMVENRLRRGGSNIKFVNDHNKYPQSIEEYVEKSKEYSKMYKFLKPYFGKQVSYSDFESNIFSLLKKDKKNAVAKLMTLSFFYDALKNFSKDAEFWTDILYLGMKVGKKFAPHAKIS